jgi:AmmeMemoRadiSam system protein B
MVPHAGWVFSGGVAAEAIQAGLARGDIETVVIFGAVHRRGVIRASVYASGAWQTPLGQIAVDEELAAALLDATDAAGDEAEAHSFEHAIEVQVPIVQAVAPAARLLPIMVPPMDAAPDIGRVAAEQARVLGRRVRFLGSTDLTHYGPRYGFIPQGVGEEGLRWAKEVNDRGFLDRVLAMQSAGLVDEARTHHNACGPGAVAATIEACRVCGAERAVLLRHVTSNEVAGNLTGGGPDAVGYAGVVFVQTGE